MTKKIYIAITVLFVVFGILQYNDPDPLLWMLIYGSVALVGLMKVYLNQINFTPLIVTLLVIFSLYALVFIPSIIDFISQRNDTGLKDQMDFTKSQLSLVRQFSGLLVSLMALLYLLRSKS